MHPAVSLVAENALQYQHLLFPVAFFLFATNTAVNTPIRHSLLITTVSWALLWLLVIFKAGIWSIAGNSSRKTASWSAGIFLAFAQICDRAAHDREGIWWSKSLLPLFVYIIPEFASSIYRGASPSHVSLDDSLIDPSNSEKHLRPRSFRLFAVITLSAATVLATPFNTSATSVLGICSTLSTALGLYLFDSAIKTPKEDEHGSRRGFMSANGTFSRRSSLQGAQKDDYITTLRDVAAVMTVACGLATYFMESFIPGAIEWGPRLRNPLWKEQQYSRIVWACLAMIFLGMVENLLLLVMLFQQGVVNTSFILVASYIYARLSWATSFSGIWFTIIFVLASGLFLYNSSSTSTGETRGLIRLKRIIILVAGSSFLVLALQYLSLRALPYTGSIPEPFHIEFLAPTTPLQPIPIDLKKGHPADQLTKAAENEFREMLGRQSKSLAEAVAEYRRRYGLPPPPHFDRWYEFATRNGVQLIDEFDSIYDSFLPFWSLKPKTIRERAKMVLGNDDNAVIGMMIRDGAVVKVEHGEEWQQQATTWMMKDFIKFLPDMDLAFNIHDEPRVVVPHDQLNFLVSKAKDSVLPPLMQNKSPRDSFSQRPADMNDGRRFEEAKVTRFNKYAHQQTWSASRLSCSIDSQARNYEESPADNLTAYGFSPLNYVYNATAFSDICNSPSFSHSFGFFERPNAFNIIHELTPIFSQSKISSFQDILYPSPWYWFDKVVYQADRDTTWENKINSLYWRGSTTGGFSRNGGWRRQHRQHIVRRVNAPDTAKIYVNKGSDQSPDYQIQEVKRKEFGSAMDVHFSHIGQCDPGDCNAQKEFFEVTDRVDGQDAWKWKHLLDMDGNAFSGRFYTFLQSRSLTYKMAIFREWHSEWLRPWVHYIPLSLIGDEYLDLVKWFGGVGDDGHGKAEKTAQGEENKGGNGNSAGEKKAREIAERSSEWAKKTLRHVDFEAWFFRLLLEYGRIIDDNRDTIGYPGP